MLREGLAGRDERAVRERVERGPEAHLMARELHELAHAHEAFAQAPFEHFRLGDVVWGWLFAFGVVDVFGDDAAVADGGVEDHAGEGLAELVAGDKGPEDPVDGQGCYDAHDESEASGPSDGDDGGGGSSCVGAQRDDGEA